MTTDTAHLLDQARAWIADDPDEVTRAELESVVAAAESGDAAALDDLADRFRGLLAFGTAGLRGALGAGPNRMNRVVVLRAAAGLTRYLQTSLAKRDVTVVIGYDARTNSDVFAADTAAVVTAAGGRALVLPRPLATPVLAFAIRYVGADAGVMVTASHNPPQDNGYKVYLGDGSQIVPPSDAQIAAQIDRVASVASVPRAESGWEVLGDELLEPTRIYSKALLDLVRADGIDVHALSHVTGGGLAANLARVLPQGTIARVDRASWTPPPIFSLVGELGAVPRADLERTLNMGIGFAAALPQAGVDAAIARSRAAGIDAWVLGEVADAATTEPVAGVEVVQGAKGVHGGAVQVVGEHV